MTVLKFQSKNVEQGYALKIAELDETLAFTLAVVSSKGMISTMEGEWHPDFVYEGEMNIKWGVPKMQMENVLNGKDFKFLSQKGIQAAIDYCEEQLNNQSKNTGGDYFGL